MKSQKTNAFQLAIAGGVLVLVLVCATFAWFAVGDHAWVSKITASLTPPEVPSQLNSIEYQSGDYWVPYDGSHLDIEPGKAYTFRVKFTAKENDPVTIAMRDFSVTFREATSADSETESGEATTEYKVVTEPLMLSDMLEYRLNPKSEEDTFVKLPVDKATNSAVIVNNEVVDSTCKIGETLQYCYVYEIRLSGDAGNDYMGKKLSFVMTVDLPNSDSSSENSGAEG